MNMNTKYLTTTTSSKNAGDHWGGMRAAHRIREPAPREDQTDKQGLTIKTKSSGTRLCIPWQEHEHEPKVLDQDDERQDREKRQERDAGSTSKQGTSSKRRPERQARLHNEDENVRQQALETVTSA